MPQHHVRQNDQSRTGSRQRTARPRQAARSRSQSQQRARHARQQVRPRPRRRARPNPAPLVVAALIVVALLVFAVVNVVSCVRGGASDKPDAGASGTQTADSAQVATTPATVSFCAVGDNLINEAGDWTVDLLGFADAWSGETGDGAYDFSPLYAQIRDEITSYDIAFINQETTLGGNDEFDYEGYPSYNTPDEMAQAVADAGFDVVNCNTNHTYDTWTGSIEHAQKVWSAQDGIDVIGSYTSQKDRDNIRVVERNGMSIAFLSYSYGQNGYAQADLPNDYYEIGRAHV